MNGSGDAVKSCGYVRPRRGRPPINRVGAGRGKPVAARDRASFGGVCIYGPNGGRNDDAILPSTTETYETSTDESTVQAAQYSTSNVATKGHKGAGAKNARDPPTGFNKSLTRPNEEFVGCSDEAGGKSPNGSLKLGTCEP